VTSSPNPMMESMNEMACMVAPYRMDDAIGSCLPISLINRMGGQLILEEPHR
jgi:hypothetical protein